MVVSKGAGRWEWDGSKVRPAHKQFMRGSPGTQGGLIAESVDEAIGCTHSTSARALTKHAVGAKVRGA